MIKKIIKKNGRFFVDLKQADERIIAQSILIIDNGSSWLRQVNSAIEKIRNQFPKAEISVLTFEQRKFDLQKDFPTLKFILPSQNLRPKRYQIALQMLMLRKERYDFTVLFSLDITPLIVTTIFLKSKKVVLYNQWRQWWSLRLRNINEIFKVTYVKKKTKFYFKNLLKKIGLFFVLLQREDEGIFKHSILVVDNGYVDYDQVHCAIQRIKESLPYAKISVLALEQRQRLKDNFSEVEFILSEDTVIKKYKIALNMLRLRHNRYDYIILLSLDITLIIVSILFMKGKVLLYNRWHQWWSLKPKPIRQYLMAVPRFIFNTIINILIFVYLLISVSWIFLKKSFNVFRFNLSRRVP